MSFQLLRIFAYVAFGLLPVIGVVATVVFARRRQRGLASVAGAATAIVVGIGIDAFLIEPHALEVTHLELASDRVDTSLTIALIADIQTDDPGPYEKDVLRRVAEAKPDLILLAGDYVQTPGGDREAAMVRLRSMLADAAWAPRLGAYAVGGNSEVGIEDWPSLFEGTGIEAWPAHRVTRDLGPLVLTGLPLRDSFDTDAAVRRTDAKLHVVFGHAPDYSLGDIDADLLLAGHTHGGQVRVPFFGPPVTFSRVPRDHAAGLTGLEDGRRLYVSRGIGMERGAAPRLRFLCRPELVFLHIVPSTP